VTADGTLTLTSAPGTTNQTVCINNPITNITYAVGGSGTGGSVTGLPAGVTGNFAGGVITISGTPTAPGTFNYTVNTTGPCATPNATGTITVNDNSTLNLTSGPGSNVQTVCINTPITNITYAVSGGGTGASITAGSLPAGVSGSFAGGVFTISGSPTVSGVFNYTITTTGPCINPSASGTITVRADATLTLTSAPGTTNQTVCINTPITNITYAVGGTGTGGSVSGLPAGVNGNFAGGVITISGTPTAPGTFNYTVNTTGPCATPNATGTITVNDNSTLSLSSGPGSNVQTVCINTPITNITYAVGGGGTGASITAGSLPAGVSGSFAGSVFTITGSPTVSGVFNYTVSTTGPCINPSASGTITVTADGTLTLTSAPGTTTQTVCINNPITNITYAVGGSGTGGSVTGLPAGVNGNFAGGVITISGTPTAPGTFNYTVNTTGPCATPNATGTITVDDNSTLTLSSAPGSNVQTVCINNPITDITYAIGGGGTGASITAGSLPAGVSGSFAGGVFTITGTPTTSGTYNFTVGTAGPCVNTSLSGTITVTAASTMNLSSGPGTDAQTVCINVAIANIRYSIGGSGTGASITAGSLPAGVNGSFAGGVFTISGTPTVSGTFNYTVSSTGPCLNPTMSGTITINPDHTISLSSGASTTNQTVCSDKPIAPIAYTLGGGASGATVTGLPPGVTSSIAGTTLTISGAPSIAGVFNYFISTTGNSCVTASKSGSITVLQTPAITFLPVAGVCADVPSFQVNASPAFGIFSGPGINATGLFNPAAAGPGNHIIRYTYTAANGCSNFQEQTLAVYPLPPTNAGPDKFMLEGGQVTLTPALNASMPVTYLWTPNFHLSDPTIAYTIASPPYDFTYTLTVTTDNGCAKSDDVFVKVLKAPAIPNIFSPNGDGVHDTWVIQYLESYPGCTVDIFNRYGQRIYHSEGYSKPWDGTINGNPVPIGTYYYIIDPKNGRKIMSGYVDVVR
jgi:gliding motility-associated-like protein